MNTYIVDGIIVALVIGSVFRGYQIGFVRQLGSTIGFLIGLYPGSLLASWVMTKVDGVMQPLIGLAMLLTVCFFIMTITELYAVRIKFSITNKTLQGIDNYLGSFISIATILLGVWLASAIFQLAPNNSVQTAVNHSRIVGYLNNQLPPVSRVLSALNSLIDPNQSPQVFAGREPSPDATYELPSTSQYSSMLAGARQSVVKIEGLGCGGIVDGSGFVYAKNRVVTNAHVVAGVDHPKITDSTGTHTAKVVLFDANNDLAVLYSEEAGTTALPINYETARDGTPVFSLGYPGGGEYAEEPGVIMKQLTALGQDIYGQNRTTRSVYTLQSHILPGNSGGPVIDTNGAVRGVVFATSTTYNNIGYALTAQQIKSQLESAVNAIAAQDTGKCSE